MAFKNKFIGFLMKGRTLITFFASCLLLVGYLLSPKIAPTQPTIPTSTDRPVPNTITSFSSPATITPTQTIENTRSFIPTNTPNWHSVPWAEALRVSANSFIRTNPVDALALVQSFDYVHELPGSIPQESADNTCGPLGVSILSKAGIFYPLRTPIDLHDWWEPNPAMGMPWGMLDMSHYTLYQFLTKTQDGIIGSHVTRKNIIGNPSNAVQKFDFTAFPLCPGDWIYTHSIGSGFDHMWTVSEVDNQGRAYAVGNIPAPDSDLFIINRILLYDPHVDPFIDASNLRAGGFRRNFINHHA